MVEVKKISSLAKNKLSDPKRMLNEFIKKKEKLQKYGDRFKFEADFFC